MDIKEIAKLLGKRGGLKTKQTQGPGYYKKIGKKGALKHWGKPTTKEV